MSMQQLIVENTPFAHLLQASAEHHSHVCPRQVIGVRMGQYAGQLLGLQVPQAGKRLFTFIETDGCMLDGVVAGTGCTVGRRTMHIYDFGKMAASFVDRETEQAVRIAPNPQARESCPQYAPDAADHWHAYVYAYQVMPVDRLLVAQLIHLTVSMEAIISRKKARAVCDCCGEEIFNDREVVANGTVLCRACAGQAYYAARQTVAVDALPGLLCVEPR